MPPKPKREAKPKIATGSMLEVWEGKFPQTRAGLKKADLMLSPKGKVKSIAAHEKAELKKRQRQKDKCEAFYDGQQKRMPPFDVGELLRYEMKTNNPNSEAFLGTIWEVKDKDSGGYRLQEITNGKPRWMEISKGESRQFRRV